MRFLCCVLAILMACCGLVGVASAADKVALVIGVNDYANVPKLEKAVGDADAVGAKLRNLGFDVAISLNPDRGTLVRALADLRSRARGASVVVVHFSGHGVAVDGENYLLPVDVSKPGMDKQLLEDESISQSQLIQKLTPDKGESRSLVLIIDACRDNPYMEATRSVGTERGLSRVEPPRGVFIMYSAGFGETALDRLGDNDKEPTSVYTRVLLQQLSRPGANLIDIANDARTAVEKLAGSVGHQQRPANYDQLDGRKIVLLPAEVPVVAPADAPVVASKAGAAPSQTTPAPAPADDVARAFEAAKQIDTVDALEAFIAQYPDSFYAKLAHVLINEKKEPAVAAVEPKAPPPPAALQDAPPAVPPTTLQDAPPTAPQDAACTVQKGPWSVAGDADDALYVRSGPGQGYGVVIKIPPGTSGLVRGDCADGGRWCQIQYDCRTGWVAARRLRLSQAADASPPLRRMRVIGVDEHDKLHVRAAPGPSSAEVGELPPNAEGVELSRCTHAGGASWCQVSWHGVSGWANGRYLAQD